MKELAKTYDPSEIEDRTSVSYTHLERYRIT